MGSIRRKEGEGTTVVTLKDLVEQKHYNLMRYIIFNEDFIYLREIKSESGTCDGLLRSRDIIQTR